MNIEPGTRVRSTEDTGGILSEGIYMGLSKSGRYHVINWYGWSNDAFGFDLHLEDEFEVI